MDITKLKAFEIKEKLKSGEISCREIVESYFHNIEEVEEKINAFISFDREQSLKDAEKIDEKIKNGEEIGSLSGFIVSLKDNIMTKDFKTTAGSKFLEEFVSPYDATVVEKIKAEDGIIIGKNNMDEFGIEGEDGILNLGNAAAVAFDEAMISLGSDTDGSLRQIANDCGLVGFKPSYGSISRHGLLALADSMDQIGIVSKNVEDSIHMFKSISGKDELDPSTKEIDLGNIKGSTDGVKIGIVKEFMEEEMDEEIREELEKSIEKLKENGAIIEEISIPNIKYALKAHSIIMNSDISTNLARFDGLRYGYRAKDYTTLDELYINSRTDDFGDEVKKRILLGTYLLSNGEVDYYKKALKFRNLLIKEFDNAFGKIDVLISPINKVSNVPVNITGLCAIAVPSKKEENHIGIQFIGDRFKEKDILNAALAYEGLVK
jgi:aspartyl-tRNA(Asn)/glutamyl-tRNA(Gln) amidotransferase subunit A